MHCGGIEEEDDISTYSASSSSSPSGIQRGHDRPLHSPLSAAASTTSSSLSIDLNHSPITTNSSPNIHTGDSEQRSGLNLLVAALDAQDPCEDQQFEYQNHNRFDHSAISEEIAALAHLPISDEDTASERLVSRRKSSIPDISKDDAYWEKRKRNNEAAKRSREKRRVNDMAVEARLMELSRENNLLKHELDSVKKHQLTSPNPTPSYLFMPTNPNTTPSASNTISEIASRIPAASPTHTPLVTSASQASFASLAAPRPQYLPNAAAAAAAASFVNPLLAAVIPPAVLLQAIAQQQQRPSASPPVPIRPTGKRFNPYSVGEISQTSQNLSLLSNDRRQHSPVTPMLAAALSAPASPGPPPTASSFLDGKQYLRYKLLERQLQQQQNSAQAGSSPSLNLTGSVISNAGSGLKTPQQRPLQTPNSISPQGPPAKRQRAATQLLAGKMTTSDLIRADADTSLSLKECLSSLAVSLISPGGLSIPSLNGEKASNGCDSSTVNTAPSSNAHQSPIASDEQQSGNHNSSIHSLQSNGMASLGNLEDGVIGDLLRARTHSDSSQSSAGISNRSSSSSGSAGAIGQDVALKIEMDYRNSFFSDRRRDSNNSDSGIVSDGANDPGWNGACGKRYRSDHERYMERRRRNNEAAKRCRANRRAMFEYRYQRAQELENENARLKEETRMLSQELAELKEMLANRDGIIFPMESVPENVAGAFESARIRKFVARNRLNEDGDLNEHSVKDGIQRDDTQPIVIKTADIASRGLNEETPLDFTLKKEKI